MKRIFTNGLLAFVALVVPLIAEYVTATPDDVPGTGFSVLLYEPFDFAYVLLVAFCFVILNMRYSLQNESSLAGGALLGIGVTALWFLITFFAVGQMHLSLGGKL